MELPDLLPPPSPGRFGAAVVLPMVNPLVPADVWSTPAEVRQDWFTAVDAAGARGVFLAVLTIWAVAGTVPASTEVA